MVSRTDAQALLRLAMTNPKADFREGQWEAIDHIVNQRGKALCIQRTGWGKSMVYFVAAKLMRAQGRGGWARALPVGRAGVGRSCCRG